MIKKILFLTIFLIVILFINTTTIEAGWVNGYYRKDGTYVRGYYRSNPNGLKFDNYSFNYKQPLFNNSYFFPTKNYNYNWYRSSYLYQNDYWIGYYNYLY